LRPNTVLIPARKESYETVLALETTAFFRETKQEAELCPLNTKWSLPSFYEQSLLSKHNLKNTFVHTQTASINNILFASINFSDS
jgi:hypothetical protein